MSIAAVSVLALLGGVLGAVGFGPALAARRRERAEGRRRGSGVPVPFDPGRELRAERKARELLRSVVSEPEFAMYDELGFLRLRPVRGGREAPYAYLIYPHRPIVAYDVETAAPLSEYCVDFPDREETELGSRLPDADDVLAKWMSLSSGERDFLTQTNLHQPGRQIDPAKVLVDIRRAEAWIRSRTADSAAPRLTAAAAGNPA